MKEPEMEKKEKLLEEGLELLTNEVMNLKLDHRADIDGLKLEIETLKLFLAQIYPDFHERFQTLREKARLEISPE